MILDTSFIIDLLRGNAKAIDQNHRLAEMSEPRIVTAITIHELWTGFSHEGDSSEISRAKELLDKVSVQGFDETSAKISGEINGELMKRGEMIDSEDCMIAGIALAHSHHLLTRNVKDFSKIKGLKVETY